MLNHHLKIFHADRALDSSGVPGFVQFDFARFLVIAERAVELRVQRLQVPPLWWRASLGLSPTHSVVIYNSSISKKL